MQTEILTYGDEYMYIYFELMNLKHTVLNQGYEALSRVGVCKCWRMRM